MLPMSQDKSENESIVLLSKKIMKKYRVYLDEEVGFPSTYRDDLHETPVRVDLILGRRRGQRQLGRHCGVWSGKMPQIVAKTSHSTGQRNIKCP